MRNTFAIVGILAAAWVQTSGAQGLPDQMNFSQSNTQGFHIYGASAFFGYSSFDFPDRTANPNALAIDSRANYGASGTVGWQRFRGKTNISARFTGSYFRDTRYSSLNSFDYSFNVDVSRTFGQKWKAAIGATGQDIALAQYIYQYSPLGSLAQSGASFDNLAAASSIGQFSNAESGLLLGGSQQVASPTSGVLLGSYFLTYNIQASLSYEFSPRLSFTFSSFAMGGQHRYGNQYQGVGVNYVTPRTLGGDAGVSLKYALSPRTDIGVSATQNYVNSTFQKSSATTASASFGRKMGAHWFLRGFGGGSYTHPIGQTPYISPPIRQAIWGGSVGFRTYSNVLLASYNRTGYDASSGVIGTNTNFSGAWHWHHPRSNWGLQADFTSNRTTSTGFSTFSGWRATGGFSRYLGSSLNLLATYSHLDSRGDYLNIPTEVIVSGLRITLAWTPHLRREESGVMTEEAVEP